MTTRSGREGLAEWCRKQINPYPGMSINDFTWSWADGRVMCALVDSLWPKSFDVSSLRPQDAAENLERAFSVAEEHGVSRLLDVEEVVVATTTDKLQDIEPQLITYVSQLYRGSQEQKCARCELVLALINIECNGKHYHPDCFVCQLCKQKLTSTCVEIDGLPYCEICGKKAFKVQTWKVNKKQKENWWMELWQNNQTDLANRSIKGWNPDGRELKKSKPRKHRTIGKLPHTSLNSSDASIGDNPLHLSSKSTNPFDTTNEVPINLSSSSRAEDSTSGDNGISGDSGSGETEDIVEDGIIGIDDAILADIDDEKEKEAFIYLFSALPDPDSIPVHLSLSQSSLNLNSSTTTSTPSPVKYSPAGGSSSSSSVSHSNFERRMSKPLPPLPPSDSPLSPPPLPSRHSILHTPPATPLPPTPSRSGSQLLSPERESSSSRLSTISPNTPPSSSLSSESDPPIKEGYLIKKTDIGIVKLWQKRYFLLKRDHLLYFIDRDCRERSVTLGIIPLKSVQSIRPIAGKKGRFQLEGDNMRWYLQSETDHEMHEWISALKGACKVENERKLSPLTVAGLSTRSLTRREGPLEVRHQASWVPRWIVLKDGILFEYKDRDSGILKAKIPLFECNLREYIPNRGIFSNILGSSNENLTFCFEVTTSTRSMILRSPSYESMHEWLNDILRQKVVVEEILETVAVDPINFQD